MDSRLPKLRTLLAIFLVFSAVFGSIRRINADAGWVEALSYGFLIGLGLSVSAALAWWVSGRLPWPERPHPRFVVGQTMAASLAISLLYIIDRAIAAGADDLTFLDSLLNFEFFVWEVLLWGGMYGTFAGIGYAARGQQEVQRHRVAIAEAHTQAVQAQLDTLRGQLNPHFLFNALHSLAQLVTEDAAQAEGAIERLGDLLRYALDAEEWDVPLSREWEFTQLYLSIEELRLNGRLRVDATLDDAALAQLVPRFSLQPLVENAIRHGISQQREGGTVSIRANVAEGGDLHVLVEDNGPGADAGGIQYGSGTGLKNLRGRLNAHFGEKAELTIGTEPGKGFRVSLRIPTE